MAAAAPVRRHPLRATAPPAPEAGRTPGDPPLVAFDANVFDRVAPGDDSSARAVASLAAAGRLRLVVLPGVAAELSHPNAPPAIAPLLHAAEPLSRSRPSARQEIDRIRVRAILRGDGRPGKHDADAAHLSDAAEAGCGFFVTADGKILRKRETLGLALPATLRIVTLPEFVSSFAQET